MMTLRLDIYVSFNDESRFHTKQCSSGKVTTYPVMKTFFQFGDYFIYNVSAIFFDSTKRFHVLVML